jgi:mRNA-degrading endonuclease RelE of RelBE toxin-antitoxin system
MKTIRFTKGAMVDLTTYATVAERIIKTLERYAAGGKADVIAMRDGSGKRLRVGDYRALFEEGNDEILVAKIRPRNTGYEE